MRASIEVSALIEKIYQIPLRYSNHNKNKIMNLQLTVTKIGKAILWGEVKCKSLFWSFIFNNIYLDQVCWLVHFVLKGGIKKMSNLAYEVQHDFLSS